MRHRLGYPLFLLRLAAIAAAVFWGAWEAWVSMVHWLGACT